MKCIGYIRVSTPISAKEGESLNIQREAITNYAKEKDWTLLDIYADEGVSGAKSNRPALVKLLENVREKKFEYLIIHRLSRFGRNARDLLNNVHILKENGVQLVSIKENIDFSTSSGKLLFGILSLVAEMEREIIDEQMKESKLKKWRDGRAIVGRLPFGYFFNKEDKKNPKIEVVPKEKNLYLRIVSLYLDEGKSFSDIEEQLKKEGVKCRKAPFSSASISYVLKNPVYWGHYVVNQTKYNGKKRTKEKKPVEEHIPITINNPFITKTKWDQIQKRTQFNKSKGKRITISESYFLRDVLICGEDGGVIKPRHGNKRKNGSRPKYYSCYWSGTSEKDLKASGRKKCILPYLNASEIEEHVWSYLVSYLTLQKIIRKGQGKRIPFHELFDSKKYESKLKQLQDHIVELEKEIEKKQRARERLYGLLEEDRDHSNEFSQRLRKIDEEVLTFESKIEDNKKMIAELEESKKNDHLYKDFLRDNKSFVKHLISDLQNLSPKDKKQLVESMLRDKIQIWKGTEKRPWDVEALKLQYNQGILQRFMDEGKITSLLGKATANYPSRYEL